MRVEIDIGFLDSKRSQAHQLTPCSSSLLSLATFSAAAGASKFTLLNTGAY